MHYTSKAVYEYISKKNSDPIVKRKKCRISGQDFPIYQSDLDFYDKISPKFEVSSDYAKQFLEENSDVTQNFEYKDGKLKCKIPTPTLCPEERQRRRLAFRNERKLYKRTCDFSGKEIISIYSPDKPYKVYDQSIWWSDKWDTLEYGKDSIWNFSTIFGNLLKNIPRYNLKNDYTTMENSEYNNYSGQLKSSYFSFWCAASQDMYYAHISRENSDCCDIAICMQCADCWECVECIACRKCFSCEMCLGCNELYNCSYCTSCEECIWCSNLVNKKYCINNQQYTKEEYEKYKQQAKQNTQLSQQKNSILRNTFVLECENYAGYALNSCKNAFFCYDSAWLDTVKYSTSCGMMSNTMDNDHWTTGSDISYESLSWEWRFDIFSSNSENTSNTIYCDMCYNSNFCFGCVGLRNKEYCIFNKQYTKEEYNQLVPKLIAQMMRTQTSWTNPSFTSPFNKGDTPSWNSPLIKGDVPQSGTGGFDTTEKSEANKVPPCEGGYSSETREGGKQRWEFFDPQLSPFGYNETVAMEYYPLSKEEALKLWYKRSDYEAPFPKVEKFVQGKKLRTASCKTIYEQKPELLEKLLNYAVVCEVSGRPFRIIKQEIDFYIKHDLPLPRKHPDIRHQERMNKRPWRTLYLRNCDKCGEEMLSVYSSWKQISPNPSLSRGESTLNTEGSISLDKGRGREGFDTMQQKIYCEKCYQKEIYW